MAQWVKNLPAMQETQETRVRSLFNPGHEDPLKEEMATNSNIFAWKSHGKKSLAGPEFEKYKQNAFVYA